MCANEFVDALRQYIPTADHFKKAGGQQLSPDDIAELLSDFTPIDRPPTESGGRFLNTIEELLDRYDLSQMQIKGFKFLAAPVRRDGRFYFGEFESDRVFVDVENGEVILEDISTTARRTFRVARDCDRFLAAVALVAQYQFERVFTSLNPSKTSYQDQCAYIAGGEEYRAIWRSAFV